MLKFKQQNKRKSADPNKAHSIPQGNSYFVGNPNAKVTITEFYDFQWPYCAKSVSIIDEIMKKYPNDVKVVFKSFPLGSHAQARKAAKYAMAAGRQGKFKEMYYKIFENDNWRGLRANEDLPLEFAKELGLNTQKLMSDKNDPLLDSQITQEYNQLKSYLI